MTGRSTREQGTAHRAGSELNDEQWWAVVVGDGPIIIVAGPGSGKTRVLTHRIEHLVERRRQRPDTIVAITFTNRAAREMTNRVEDLLGAKGRAVRTSTFHRFCGTLIRSQPAAASLQAGFSIYDRDDQIMMAKRVADLTGLRAMDATHWDLINAISYAKAHLMGPADFEEHLMDYRGANAHTMELMGEPYAVYEEQMRVCNAIDLDDMIVRAVRMLERSQPLLNRRSRTR